MSTSLYGSSRRSILYRGSLSSCNYACSYCPFAKTRNTREELERDARELARFVDWVAKQSAHTIGILMTPWGEGLIREPYREAMCALSHMPHVESVAIQTNLSIKSMAWLERANLDALALWTTWHPTQIAREAFVAQCKKLDARGVNYSVGVVGVREAFEEIEALRDALSKEIYLWINAYKREPHYYSEQDLQRLEQIDPLFRYNARRHPSLGKPCQAGETALTVDGEGDVRRCHFIKQVIGNIYVDDLEDMLAPRACTAQTCGCHIGYIHLEQLALYPVFGAGLMARIPHAKLWRDAAHAHIQMARSVIGSGPLPTE